MTYAGDRLILDADSHLMELPDFLTAHADPGAGDLLPTVWRDGDRPVRSRRTRGQDPGTPRRWSPISSGWATT